MAPDLGPLCSIGGYSFCEAAHVAERHRRAGRRSFLAIRFGPAPLVQGIFGSHAHVYVRIALHFPCNPRHNRPKHVVILEIAWQATLAVHCHFQRNGDDLPGAQAGASLRDLALAKRQHLLSAVNQRVLRRNHHL